MPPRLLKTWQAVSEPFQHLPDVPPPLTASLLHAQRAAAENQSLLDEAEQELESSRLHNLRLHGHLLAATAIHNAAAAVSESDAEDVSVRNYAGGADILPHYSAKGGGAQMIRSTSTIDTSRFYYIPAANVAPELIKPVEYASHGSVSLSITRPAKKEARVVPALSIPKPAMQTEEVKSAPTICGMAEEETR